MKPYLQSVPRHHSAAEIQASKSPSVRRYIADPTIAVMSITKSGTSCITAAAELSDLEDVAQQLFQDPEESLPPSMSKLIQLNHCLELEWLRDLDADSARHFLMNIEGQSLLRESVLSHASEVGRAFARLPWNSMLFCMRSDGAYMNSAHTGSPVGNG